MSMFNQSQSPENEMKWRVPFTVEKAKPVTCAITPTGKQHLESNAGFGDGYKILSEINDHGGSMGISDLAAGLHMPYMQVKNILIAMQRRGYVNMRSSEGG